MSFTKKKKSLRGCLLLFQLKRPDFLLETGFNLGKSLCLGALPEPVICESVLGSFTVSPGGRPAALVWPR